MTKNEYNVGVDMLLTNLLAIDEGFHQPKHRIEDCGDPYEDNSMRIPPRKESKCSVRHIGW